MKKRLQLFPETQILAMRESWFNEHSSRLHGVTVKDVLAAREAYEAQQAETFLQMGYQVPEDGLGYAINSAGTALFNMCGPLSKEITYWQWMCGGTSMQQLQLAFSNAASDDQVKQGILYTDSPGGTTAGVQDAADAVTKFAQKKPLLKYNSDLSASAAEWLGSGATTVWANSTAVVGSWGVFLIIPDFSQMFSEAGIKIYVARYGEFKGAGAMGTEVTEAQLAEFQRLVQSTGDLFVKAMAKGRGMTLDAAKAIADGRVHVGQEAVALGLVDKIGTFEDAQKALESGKITVRKPGVKAEVSQELLAEQIDDVLATEPQLTGATMAEHSESVLTAVRGLKSISMRAKGIKDLRLNQGKTPLSEKVRASLSEIRGEIDELLSEATVSTREPSTSREVNQLRLEHLKRAAQLSALGVTRHEKES